MEKTKLLTILIGITLALTLVNLYSTFSLYGKLDSIAGKIVTEPEAQPMPAANGPQQPSRIQVSADDDPVKGDKNAPVTIIEFSDFQCPYCGRFYLQTLPKIEENYIKAGKVKFVYRDYPLSFHQFAQKAAEASECADEQGKFWEYHNKIFENQQLLSIENLKKWALDLGLDKNKFDTCLDLGKYEGETKKDFQDGAAAGVTGTPAFFINGILVEGAHPFETFKAIIEAELAK